MTIDAHVKGLRQGELVGRVGETASELFDLFLSSKRQPPDMLRHRILMVLLKGSARKLTSAQMSILNLLSEGRAAQEIADELNCKISTVKVQLTAIYMALGVENRTQAIWAWKLIQGAQVDAQG